MYLKEPGSISGRKVELAQPNGGLPLALDHSLLDESQTHKPRPEEVRLWDDSVARASVLFCPASTAARKAIVVAECLAPRLTSFATANTVCGS